jgi:3',5'-cyclic AMP phosphodiesterase CpdA
MLPARALVVPGNHDVPLYNLALRGLWPLERFRRYITNDLAPFYEDSEIAVLGVNTARARTFKNGRINQGQIDSAIRRFALCGTNVTRIVVTHHAFETPDAVLGDMTTHGLVGRATMAVAGFMQAGVDMILSGHLHLSGVGETGERYPTSGRAMLLIQAGTATSTRRRGEVNAFNVVRITRPEVVVECRTWQADEGCFTTASAERFERTTAGWSRSPPS